MNWGSFHRGDRNAEYSGAGLVFVMMRTKREAKENEECTGRKENELKKS